MVPETRAETFDFPRLMNKCLWLDYPERNKGEEGIDRKGVRGLDLEKKSTKLLLLGKSGGY